MQIPVYESVKTLNVDFEGTDFGWIYLILKIGGNSYRTRFSEVFDPLPNFKHWLEAICIGAQQCSFSFDTEGSDIKFNFESIGWDRELFTVSYDYREIDGFFLSDYVDRKQLVKVFYCGFLDFCNSPNFNKYQWENISYADFLTEWLELEYKTVLIGLLQFSGEELNKWLDKVNPQCRKDFFSERDKIEWANELKVQTENWKITANLESQKIFDDTSSNFVETGRCNIRIGEIIDNLDFDSDNEFAVRGIINYGRAPYDYDNWCFAEKKKFIEDYLSLNYSDCNGTKIADFKSKIIEDYLKQETL